MKLVFLLLSSFLVSLAQADCSLCPGEGQAPCVNNFCDCGASILYFDGASCQEKQFTCTLNPSTLVTTCPCNDPTTEYYDGSECASQASCEGSICPCALSGYFFDGGSCVSNSTCTSTFCPCLTNFFWNGALCQATSSCSDGVCPCSTDFYWNGTSCQPSNCWNGQVVITGCSCYSGYTGDQCSTNAANATLPSVSALSTEIVAEFQVSQSSISNGVFSFVINSPARNMRYFQWIALVGNLSVSVNSDCAYPGSNIIRSFNSTGSFDSFSGQISLGTLLSSCLFANDTLPEAPYTDLTGIISVSAIDPLGEFRGVTIQRTTSSFLKIKLRIPTHLNLTASSLDIYSPINFLAAITEQSFDANTYIAVVVITSSVQWPYTISNSTLLSIPSNLGSSVSTTISSTICNNSTIDSVCVQLTTLTITGACQFSGLFSIDWSYGCRADSTTCSQIPSNDSFSSNITLVSDNGCGAIEIDAQLQGSLEAFPDSTFTSSAVTFIAGNPIYFRAHITSSLTVTSVAVLELTMINQGVSTQLVSGGVSQLPSINYDSTVGSPSVNDAQFSFVGSYGSGSGYLFQIDSETVQTVTITALIQVTYATTFGRKRDYVKESMVLSTTFVAFRA